MAEQMKQLNDLLRDATGEIDVPRPDAQDILARGRSLRRRRRAITGAVAVAAVAAIGIGGVALQDLADDNPRGEEVAAPDTGSSQAEADYRRWGAWASGTTVTVGSTTVTVDEAPRFLAQTSAGVVTETDTGSGTAYALIRPDGTRAPLSIPSTVAHVEGDINAPRIAWLEPLDDQLALHVWDVTTDREVGWTAQPSSGTRAGESSPFLRGIVLDGDFAYFSTDDGTNLQVDWADGGTTAYDFFPASARNGIGVALIDNEDWVLIDADRGTVLRDLPDDVVKPVVSPDGRRWLSFDETDHGDGLAGSLHDVDGDRVVPVPAITSPVSTFTADGHVLQEGAEPGTVVACGPAGTCATREVEGNDGAALLVLADYAYVG